jgi:hypothetical protein
MKKVLINKLEVLTASSVEMLQFHRPSIRIYPGIWFHENQVKSLNILTVYLFMAFPSASIVSMSRWFVGSSSTRKFGLPMHILAKATRDFWPPDKLATVCKAMSPVIPKLPNWRRYSSTGLPI